MSSQSCAKVVKNISAETKAIKNISDILYGHIQLLEAMINNMPNVVLAVFDKEYNYVYTGGSLLDLSPYKNLLGSNLKDVQCWCSETKAIKTEIYSRILKGQSVSIDYDKTHAELSTSLDQKWTVDILPIYNGASDPILGMCVISKR
tara:strand:- start:9961 stop:10401 length:441 start_codon:yes stop_codon:yes gene_type:complete